VNPLLVIVALVVALFSWILGVSLRRGEFRYRSRGSAGIGGTLRTHVKRSERPVVFWILAAFHAGVILYVASFVFQLE
jgi:hypothetical protein